MIQNMDKFEKSQKIKFKNNSLLIEAFTHKSANKEFNNEPSGCERNSSRGFRTIRR